VSSFARCFYSLFLRTGKCAAKAARDPIWGRWGCALAWRNQSRAAPSSARPFSSANTPPTSCATRGTSLPLKPLLCGLFRLSQAGPYLTSSDGKVFQKSGYQSERAHAYDHHRRSRTFMGVGGRISEMAGGGKHHSFLRFAMDGGDGAAGTACN
jgi:hypothetical protein